MSRKAANERVLEFIDHYSTTDNSLLEVEFFFYTSSQDDASNLSIDLFKLGYKLYAIDEPDAARKNWGVMGITKKMKMDDESITIWTDKMDALAEANNAEFDGWGTLIDPEI